LKFQVGKTYLRTDAYGNVSEMKVIDRTDTTVLFEEYTRGGRVTREFEIEIDDGRRYGDKYIDIGTWQGIRHYIYA